MNTEELKKGLEGLMEGEVVDDAATLKLMSRDTSLFSRVPELVAYPEDAADVSAIVREVGRARAAGADVSLAARSAGTDMSGGPLTTGVVVSFTKHMNHMLEVGDDYAITEPGVFYRDFEKATLKKDLILPSYPASRSIAAMGGIVSNNSGGERTLKYGKTEKYVESLDVVLSDGTQVTPRSLRRTARKSQRTQPDTRSGASATRRPASSTLRSSSAVRRARSLSGRKRSSGS